MAQVGVAIVKSVLFRGVAQQFSNVYHFKVGTLPSASEADSLIDYLTTQEKTWHSNVVSFVHGRVWSSGGTPAENNQISEKTLSGTGGLGAVFAGMDHERAYLFKWNAGFDSRGHRVTLKKWYHTMTSFPGTTGLSNTILQNDSSFSTADRNAAALLVQAVGTFTLGGKTYTLCAKSGRDYDSNSPDTYKWLEHHQLGDQWRG